MVLAKPGARLAPVGVLVSRPRRRFASSRRVPEGEGQAESRAEQAQGTEPK